MPPRADNPITAYFHPISSNPRLRSQVRNGPSPPKRARQADEDEITTRQSSRKKSKTPNKAPKERQQEQDDYLASILPETPKRSHRPSDTANKELNRRVIEIEDSPPSMPAKPACLRHATPPSSPLPELTPSPEIEALSLPCPSLVHRTTETVKPGPSAPSESGSPRRRQAEFEFIPSSQTQALDSSLDYETATPVRTLETLSAKVTFRSHGPAVHSQNLKSVFSSQSNVIPFDHNSDLDEFVASSQSQAMPASPVDLEIELVSSSQTQELFYSQRPGFYQSQESEPESSPSPASQLDRTVAQSRMSSPSEESEFRVGASRDSAHLPSSQASEARRDDEPDSYGSLPDVVQELQGMFGDTYESFPPDFPMSLR